MTQSGDHLHLSQTGQHCRHDSSVTDVLKVCKTMIIAYKTREAHNTGQKYGGKSDLMPAVNKEKDIQLPMVHEHTHTHSKHKRYLELFLTHRKIPI